MGRLTSPAYLCNIGQFAFLAQVANKGNGEVKPMKRLVSLGIILLGIVALVASVPVLAADENATITITMEGPAVSIGIGVNSGTWTIPAVEANSTYSQTFTLTNNSNVTVDTTIKGTNATGSEYKWVLVNYADTWPQSGAYAIVWSVEESEGSVVAFEARDFIQNLPAGNSQNFNLTIHTPPEGGVFPAAGESLQATVTISAVQD